MTLRIVVALAFALAVVSARAAEPIRPLNGESAVSYQCRSALLPEARQCVARCDASLASQEEARFECVHACTTKGLREISECRSRGTRPGAAATVASR
jgi:hypothetical protein